MDEAKVPYSAFGRLKGRAQAWFSKPANTILLIFLIALIVLTLYPLLSLLMETIMIHPGREARAAKEIAGDFSLYHFQRLFATAENEYSRIQFYEPFLNTLLVSLASSVIAIVFGGTVAFMVTRTNLKCVPFISAVFTFPYIMPSWTLALFWETFFKNVNIGLKTSNGIMAAVFGVYMPEWFVYGAFPISLVLGLHYAPYAFILIGGMLRNMDANLEEAATILRTSRARIIWCITLPIVKPARSLIDSYPGQAYIIAAVMILMGIVILMLNQRVTNSRKHFTTVTGKSAQLSRINLGKANYPVTIILVVLLVLVAVLPLVTFALESVIIKAGDYSLSNMTLDFWIGTNLSSRLLDQGDSTGILLNPKVWHALFYTLGLAATCAFAAGTCGILIGYGVANKRRSRLANAVNTLSFFPYLMPSLAFGAIYLAMSSRIPWLRGFLLLALVGSVKYLPFSSRTGMNAMLQLGKIPSLLIPDRFECHAPVVR